MSVSRRHFLTGTPISLVGLLALGTPAIAQSNPATASSDSVPAIVEAWAEAWNGGDAEGMAALFVEDGIYEDYAFQASWQGRDGVSQWVTLTVANIPDARVEILDAYQAGNRATVRWVFHGTPKQLATIPGTGRSFAVSAVTVFELEDGKIRRLGDFYNLANLLRQLGLPSGVWTPPFGSDVLR